jgi:putative oxidoreductase
MYKNLNSFFERLSPFAPMFIRLLIGFHLIYGTHDKIFSIEAMQGIGSWFQTQGIPFPFFSAYLSAYCQFICGSFFILGLFTRVVGLVMVINFICAIGFAHIGDTYPNTFPAVVMLAGSLFLLFNGAGNISIDSFRNDLNKLNQIESWDTRDGF